MNLSFEISFDNISLFVSHWATKYSDANEIKYESNIGKPLTEQSRLELFEWKNGSVISQKKLQSIYKNYPLNFDGDKERRYLNHKESGGAIWNIFYLHCLTPNEWPIFDQHTYRAMKFIKTNNIVEISSSDKQKYESYLNEYVTFWNSLTCPKDRDLDRALFAFGKFLKMAVKYA